MKYTIVENENKIILNVELDPYRTKGDSKNFREQFNSQKAIQIIKENNHVGFILESQSSTFLDNKFNPSKGTFVFVQQNISEKPLHNNDVDNNQTPVLKSSKRRRRKTAINTDK